MNDPHVNALIYTLKVRETVTFVSPPPVLFETPVFAAKLADGELRIDMKEHFADAESAKSAVRGFLDAWELHDALTQHRRDVRFQFERAEIIDRTPSPPGSATGSAMVCLAGVTLSARATVSSQRSLYPVPPTNFMVTDRVRQLWDRYEASVEAREPAPSAGYYCFTTLMALAPHNTKKPDRLPWVASNLGIQPEVLHKLDKLTNKGSPELARKFSPRPIPHTGAEVNWLRMAVRVLALRLGEWEYDRTKELPKVTMSDLPAL